jgi:hypothetical protein
MGIPMDRIPCIAYMIGYKHIPVISILFSGPEGYAYNRNAVYLIRGRKVKKTSRMYMDVEMIHVKKF